MTLNDRLNGLKELLSYLKDKHVDEIEILNAHGMNALEHEVCYLMYQKKQIEDYELIKHEIIEK